MVMDARAITAALGGKWHAGYGTAPCPCCQPERRRDQSALTLHDGGDGRLLLHCKRLGCAFTDILAAAGLSREAYRAPDHAEIAKRRAEMDEADARRRRMAASIWNRARPIEGTPAEAYLRSRRIRCAMPASLRYDPACRHPQGHEAPAMVAKVVGAAGPAIHRTWLETPHAPESHGEPRGVRKAMLGGCGGGGVVLATGGSSLIVCEGIETGLSLIDRHPGNTVVAALSTSGIRGLRLRAEPGQLVLAADGDPEGISACEDLGHTAKALGWRVLMMPAPDGQDWNDLAP